jgi:hypothetical protein
LLCVLTTIRACSSTSDEANPGSKCSSRYCLGPEYRGANSGMERHQQSDPIWDDVAL